MELRKDRNRIILTAGKGVAKVVMGRKDHTGKGTNLLVQQASMTIDRDSANKFKAKLE